MMSPGQASSAISRSRAKKKIGLETAIGLLCRTMLSFMPRWKRPEHRRTNATRSRCLGSMLAWTLNTKPVTLSSPGSTVRRVARLRPRRGGVVGQPVEQRPHAEIAQGTAEEHRRQVALAVALQREVGQGTLDQRQLLVRARPAGPRGTRMARLLPRAGTTSSELEPAALAQQHVVAAGEVEHALEVLAHADRPVHRRRVQRQPVVDLVQELDRVPAPRGPSC